MGFDDPVPVDEEVEDSIAVDTARVQNSIVGRNRPKSELIVVLIAAVIFAGCAFSPPHLMDDVDAVQAQIARNMLQSGDWVTARLNGIAYLEKSPLNYWMIATSFSLFGVHDWAGRLPLVLAVVLLCWVTVRFGRWAFGTEAGFYSGLVLSTCIGLFLFTRILIPDATLTLTITMAMWCFLRTLEPGERNPRLWATLFAVFVGIGFLLKGLIAIVFPAGAAFVYMAVTRQLSSGAVWRRLHPFSGAGIIILIAAPWIILATLRNPPVFDFTFRSMPGQYHGFFWFYFINEHVLRFLNLRFPRDYNTVPRLPFLLLHMVWIFPWSVFFPAALIPVKSVTDRRASELRLLAVLWIVFLL